MNFLNFHDTNIRYELFQKPCFRFDDFLSSVEKFFKKLDEFFFIF